jgi:hypothetical protein
MKPPASGWGAGGLCFSQGLYSTQMAVCFPPLEQIELLPVPLEPGERHLLDFLLSHLSDEYEVYMQPFMNGDRPDIVIVRPDAGVLIIEVKDWHLKHYMNEKGGLSAWTLIKNKARIRSPLAQVEEYKSNLYSLHIDQLFEYSIRDKRYFSVVQLAVYFHNENTLKAREFCHDVHYTHVFGHDMLNTDDFNGILKKARLDRSSYLFDLKLYHSFQRFFRPPDHALEMGKPIKYTKRQQELIESRANTRQKVRGVAGCGKTKVLAGRAVNAYNRTKSEVLILTFNITLRNYIHDRISEVRSNFPWSGFEILNYHQFFKTQANNHGLEYDNLIVDANDEDFFEAVKGDIIRYGAILIDEVQDYEPEWLRIMQRYFLSEDGEFVVFGDEKQNIYGRTMGIDKLISIPNVLGRWNVLKDSFRMNAGTLKVAQTFQRAYFQGVYEIDDDVELQQGDLFEVPGKVVYHKYTVYNQNTLFDLVRNEVAILGVHPNDVVVLAPTYDIIRGLERRFRHVAHERTTHAGETEEEYFRFLKEYKLEKVEKPESNELFARTLKSIRRGRKLHFWANAGTVKFSTIHSFKGWETNTLVLVIRETEGVSGEELIYTALTRARKNLIVIDESGAYQSFFESIIAQ